VPAAIAAVCLAGGRCSTHVRRSASLRLLRAAASTHSCALPRRRFPTRICAAGWTNVSCSACCHFYGVCVACVACVRATARAVLHVCFCKAHCVAILPTTLVLSGMAFCGLCSCVFISVLECTLLRVLGEQKGRTRGAWFRNARPVLKLLTEVAYCQHYGGAKCRGTRHAAAL
jgi:hypothetical protein